MLINGRICSLFLLHQLSYCIAQDAILVYKIAENIINGIDKSWTNVGQSSNERQDKAVLKQMVDVTQQLYKIEDSVCLTNDKYCIFNTDTHKIFSLFRL